jgi:cytochrome bd-type quinol oxidase subunit 2
MHSERMRITKLAPHDHSAFPPSGALGRGILPHLNRGRVRPGCCHRRDGLRFAMTTLLFLAAYLTAGRVFWPHMIAYSITVATAAAPEVSLKLLFLGAIFVLLVIAVYTIGVYRVIRGKVCTRERRLNKGLEG